MDKDNKKIKLVAKNVDGFVSYEELMVLYNEAKKSSHPVVEIGSFYGKSTIALALGSKEGNGVPVYAIDPHEEWEPVGLDEHYTEKVRTDFFQNLIGFGVADIVRPLEVKSHIPVRGWEEDISVLWVDGDHSYESCRRDVDLWSPYLEIGGKLILDDYGDDATSHLPAPKKVGDEIKENDNYKMDRQVGKMIVFERVN